MSAFLTVRQAAAIHMFTDAAHYKPDGTLVEIASKVRVFPKMRAAITGRGDIGSLDAFFFVTSHFDRFDFLVLGFEFAIATMEAALRRRSGDAALAPYEFCLAGWSESRDRPEVYLFAAHDRHQAVPSRQLVQPRDASLGMGPAPLSETLAACGWHPRASAEDFTQQDGLAFFEAMRRTPGIVDFTAADAAQGYGVGGFAEHTIITRDRVEATIIRRWPDWLGRKIDPALADTMERADA